MNRFQRQAAALLTGLGLLTGSLAAHAEGQIRIAEQFGIVYLLLNVAQEQKLIEKHAKAAGVDAKVEWVKLSGGSAVNDALLSGNIEIAGAGVGPLLTLWDRTKGRQNVKGVASLGNFPYYLVSNNPAVKTIADFTDKDRIAVPAVGVSVQSRVLQLASARLWGDKEFAKLDKISVALPHPDAAAAIIKGGTEINAHFGNPPFQDQELAGNPNAHIVLNSYQVLGGPASATVLYATEKFRSENPKTYKAFIDALDALTRRKMQAELLDLWDDVRFTLLFVTHSIEEALVVGNRIALLSPHPGRMRAEINSHGFTQASLGGTEFQATAQRIHDMLFEEEHEAVVAP